jgi:uroporphyrinogen-III synthase
MRKMLTGKTVVITRPAHQAARLARQIQELGGKILILPMLEILPVSDDRNLRAALENMSAYQIAIFVSANAVHYALPYCHSPFTVPAIAIGPGTARALQEYPVLDIRVSPSHHSEGILALPILQNINGAKLAIFCGENSRPLLKNVLVARGAIVDEIVCYRRRCPDVNVAQTLMDWQNGGVNLIISTSQESLENLWRLFGNMGGEWLLHTPLLVISSAMATRAEQYGFRSIIVAGGASDEAICATLKSDYRKKTCSEKTGY